VSDARVEHLTTSGVFALDGGSWDVDNNVWLVGDDEEVMVIDAPHDADAIISAVGNRDILAILCTHGHNDHVNAAVKLGDAMDAPIMLHPEDRVLWDMTHPDREPDGELTDGETFEVAGTELTVIHTPGHAPGAVCLYAPGLGVLFSGDTLFQGGPGATGRSYSDFPTIVESIRNRLLTLPAETVVNTGHGPSTTIGAEEGNVPESG